MRSAVLALFVLVSSACGSSSSPPAVPAAPEPRPEEAATSHPLDWMLGSWANEAGDIGETWVRVDSVLVGVGWAVRDGRTPFFEVMIIHRLDGPTYFTAMPGGASQVDFTQTNSEADGIEFGNPEHDHPQKISYRLVGGELTVRLEGANGNKQYDMRHIDLEPAGSIDGEDRAFDADAAKRGGTAWAERFADQGVMWPRGSARVVGPHLVKSAIDDMVGQGRVLRWEPSAGAMSPAGDLGFTTGGYRIESNGKPVGTGVYVTVWRKTADGDWKIVFDTGV